MRRANHPGGNVSARRRATLSDVARRAGVSPVTVSRAIRHPEMVSEDLRRRIDEAVRSLNYIPNNLASALASTRTHIVGVIVPSLTNGVFDDYLGAIQDVLNPAGFEVLVLNVRYSEIEEEKAIAALLGYHPEAMIVAGTDQTERSRELLRNAGVPVVQTMDVTDDPIDLNIGLDHRAAVGQDDGARLADGPPLPVLVADVPDRREGEVAAAEDPGQRHRQHGGVRLLDRDGHGTTGAEGDGRRHGPSQPRTPDFGRVSAPSRYH